jgi:hypothetical protein
LKLALHQPLPKNLQSIIGHEHTNYYQVKAYHT